MQIHYYSTCSVFFEKHMNPLLHIIELKFTKSCHKIKKKRTIKTMLKRESAFKKCLPLTKHLSSSEYMQRPLYYRRRWYMPCLLMINTE